MSKILQVTKDVNWLHIPNACTEILCNTLPPLDLITTSFGLVLHEEKVLLANLYRGWDIPGGHVETGENPEETVMREVYEETCITINPPKLLGFQQLYVHAERPENYKYPYPVSYQVHYLATVKDIHPFTGNSETKGRDFFTLSQLKSFPNLRERIRLIEMAFKLNKF